MLMIPPIGNNGATRVSDDRAARRYQQLQAAFSGLHPELEEARRIFGATRFGSLWRITAPLLRTSLIATWCFVFIGVIRELWATIMLRWVGGQPPFPIGAVVVASARIPDVRTYRDGHDVRD
jgi:ABC-type glycerol-3-phosphate transport system permease component